MCCLLAVVLVLVVVSGIPLGSLHISQTRAAPVPEQDVGMFKTLHVGQHVMLVDKGSYFEVKVLPPVPLDQVGLQKGYRVVHRTKNYLELKAGPATYLIPVYRIKSLTLLDFRE